MKHWFQKEAGMAGKRTVRSGEFIAKLALEAIRERKTVGQLASQCSVHPTQIHLWKRQLLTGASELFADGRKSRAAAEQQNRETELYEQIGRLKMELTSCVV